MSDGAGQGGIDNKPQDSEKATEIHQALKATEHPPWSMFSEERSRMVRQGQRW